MGNFIGLTGKRFTRLFVMKWAGYSECGGPQWFCLCDCGNFKIVLGAALRSGHTKSCGCLQREAVQTHGMSRTSEYTVWCHAQYRCDNPNDPAYAYYGGRGIKFCQRWRGPNGFKNFIEDMGRRPGPGYTLERINNDGDYEPGNCKWATRKEQHGNTSRNRWFKAISPISRVYTSRNQKEFARQFSLDRACICECLKGRRKQHKGWTFEGTGECIDDY